MPSGINEQTTKLQLIEALKTMKPYEEIEILTGDYIQRKSDNEFLLNDHLIISPEYTVEEIVEIVYASNRPFFIDIPEESEVKDLILGWQSGGNCFLDTIILKNGLQIVIGCDSIGIYKNQEAFENGETLQDYFFEEN